MARKKSEHYVNNGELLNELIYYNETGIISNFLGEMFLKIATRYTSKASLYGYSYREDMIGDAVERMIEQIHKYDVTHPSKNPFAYFTQVVKNRAILTLKKEQRQREMRYELRDHTWREFCADSGITFIEQSEDDERDFDK